MANILIFFEKIRKKTFVFLYFIDVLDLIDDVYILDLFKKIIYLYV